MDPMTALTPSALTAAAVRAHLTTHTIGRTLHLLEETMSTNATALALAQAGAEHGTVIAAETQTAGRGRLGRRWFSPGGENLYCSVILTEIPASPRWLSWLPLISAVAVASAVRMSSGLAAVLKWPNDVLLNDRKVGGVLCERSGLSAKGGVVPGGVVIVGIGLNVNTLRAAFPEDLRDLATSLAIEAGRRFDRAALLASLLNALEARCDLYADRASEVEDEYRSLCATVGRRVRVELAGGERLEGRATAVLEDGTLRIAGDGPESPVLALHTADVIHLR